MEEPEFSYDFDKIASKFFELEDEIELEFRLRKRVENQPILIKLFWFINATTQILLLQRENQYNPFKSPETQDFPIIKNGASNVDTKSKGIQYLEPHRRYMNFYNPFRWNGHLPHYSHCPMRIYLLFLFNLYTFNMVMYQFIGQMIFLRVTENFIPKIDKSIGIENSIDSNSRRCVKPEQIYHANELGQRTDSNLTQLDSAYDLLEAIGSPAVVHGGLYSYFLQMVCIVMLSFLVVFLVNNDKIQYLDSISFLLSPVEERNRMKNKLLDIVEHLKPIKGEQASSLTIKCDRDHQLRVPIIKHHLEKYYTSIISTNWKSTGNEDECQCTRFDGHKEKLIDLIFKEELIRFVKPNNLNLNLYDRLMRNQVKFIFIFVAIMAGWSLFLMTSLMRKELNSRVELRREILLCKLLHQNATLLHDPYRMWQDQITSDMLEIYYPIGDDASMLMNDSKLRQEQAQFYLRQIIFELVQLGKTNVIRNFSIMVTNYIWLAFWEFYLTLCFVNGGNFEYNWIKQLQTQLNDCIHLLESLHKFEVEMQRNEFRLIKQRLDSVSYIGGSARSLTPATPATTAPTSPSKNSVVDYYNSMATFKFRKKQMDKALIITYLNFALFRSEYDSFRMMTLNTVLHHGFIPLCNSAICYYWISSSLNQHIVIDIEVFWIINFVFLFLFNEAVFFSVWFTKRIQNLYKTIDLMVAKMTLNSMQMEYIYQLWQRQMIKENELHTLYSIQLTGNQFTLAALLGVNSYAIALWLIIARSSDITHTNQLI